MKQIVPTAVLLRIERTRSTCYRRHPSLTLPRRNGRYNLTCTAVPERSNPEVDLAVLVRIL